MMKVNLYDRIRFRGHPRSNQAATVVADQARFTFLTERLVRMEWSSTSQFEDRSTYAFPTRYNAQPPQITIHHHNNTIEIASAALKLQYTVGRGAFTADNLAVELMVNGEKKMWVPGMVNRGNLRGTRRTLDECEGDAPLAEGLVSRSGWTLFDDSKNVVFDDSGWVAPRPDYDVQDWYFLGYGHEYKAALTEYARFGGQAPLIPYFILGGWWSRYWAYSEDDLRKLVAEFEENGIPLDVFVIDMDWHTPLGWTGYTWNRDLFPDPPAFLAWLHNKGLKTTLNLHPADGVHPHEEVYSAFASALDIDPSRKLPVPFKIADKTYVVHYFEMLHHPMEEQGVDFWWMDWQQGEISEVKGLDPLPWINHLHFNDIKRRGVRPMLYSRWGGLGNHRYYIGFSGDTYVTWSALQFQPYMTATAANVLYGWWSHDIGGHMGGPTDPELYARWVQFGALSPVLRLHSTKDARAERRPWAYPEEIYEAAKNAFQLRYQLIPYLYTMARVASDTNVTLCHPMYYEYPEFEAAYAARYQYFLGHQLIAAPFVFPRNPSNKIASIDIWIPPGTWVAYDTLEHYTGPRWVRLVGDINRMPLLARSGAILPLAPAFCHVAEPLVKSGTTSALPKDQLDLVIFPGQGHFELYEDDGITEAYTTGQYTWTRIETSQPNTTSWLVRIFPVEGQCEALPSSRKYTILLKGTNKPTQVSINGQISSNWQYSENEKVTIIELPYFEKHKMVEVDIKADQNIIVLGKNLNDIMQHKDIRVLLGSNYPGDSISVEKVLNLATPEARDALTRLGAPFVSAIDYSTKEEVLSRLGTLIIAQPADDSPYRAIIDFTVQRGSDIQKSSIDLGCTSESHIVDVPYACTTPEFTHWQAVVTLEWQGNTWQFAHASKALFPAVSLWRCHAYSLEKRDVVLAKILNEHETNTGDIAAHWEVSRPSLDADVNLTRCHVVSLNKLFPEAPKRESSLAAVLCANVNSPYEQDAKMEFTTNTPVKIWLNGESVVQDDIVNDTALGRFVTDTHYTQTIRLSAGVNRLIVDCPGPASANAKWFFGCAFATPAGTLLTDLTYP